MPTKRLHQGYKVETAHLYGQESTGTEAIDYIWSWPQPASNPDSQLLGFAGEKHHRSGITWKTDQTD